MRVSLEYFPKYGKRRGNWLLSLGFQIGTEKGEILHCDIVIKVVCEVVIVRTVEQRAPLQHEYIRFRGQCGRKRLLAVAEPADDGKSPLGRREVRDGFGQHHRHRSQEDTDHGTRSDARLVQASLDHHTLYAILANR